MWKCRNNWSKKQSNHIYIVTHVNTEKKKKGKKMYGPAASTYGSKGKTQVNRPTKLYYTAKKCAKKIWVCPNVHMSINDATRKITSFDMWCTWSWFHCLLQMLYIFHIWVLTAPNLGASKVCEFPSLLAKSSQGKRKVNFLFFLSAETTAKVPLSKTLKSTETLKSWSSCWNLELSACNTARNNTLKKITQTIHTVLNASAWCEPYYIPFCL